jgi:hypothetical protein
MPMNAIVVNPIVAAIEISITNLRQNSCIDEETEPEDGVPQMIEHDAAARRFLWGG